jgi:hypothetical protein
MIASIPPNSDAFSISIVGDQTDETFAGDFAASRILSHRQQLLNDRLYREYLGGENPLLASEDAKQRAQILADINCALVVVPQWWREKGNGMDLLDNNVITGVWERVQQVQLDARNKRLKKTEEAATRLTKKVESGDLLAKKDEDQE